VIKGQKNSILFETDFCLSLKTSQHLKKFVAKTTFFLIKTTSHLHLMIEFGKWFGSGFSAWEINSIALSNQIKRLLYQALCCDPIMSSYL